MVSEQLSVFLSHYGYRAVTPFGHVAWVPVGSSHHNHHPCYLTSFAICCRLTSLLCVSIAMQLVYNAHISTEAKVFELFMDPNTCSVQCLRGRH